jgi:hypothetical protein
MDGASRLRPPTEDSQQLPDGMSSPRILKPQTMEVQDEQLTLWI